MAWAEQRNILLTHIQPGKPQQNAYVERHYRTVRLDWLGRYMFDSIREVRDYATGMDASFPLEFCFLADISHQMMNFRSKVLIECENLALATGTGIATYARNLAAELRNLSYQTAGLFGVRAPILSSNAALNEIQLLDARPRGALSFDGILREVASFLYRDAFGVRPQPIRRTGIVLDPGSPIFSDAFDEVVAVSDLAGRSREHFYRYGQLMPVANTSAFDVFHTTHAVPMRMRGTPSICTIHDIIPLRLPYATLDNKRFFYNLIKELVTKLDHIVTVSDHSRRDLIQFFNVPEDRITNTYQSVYIPQDMLEIPEDEVARDLRRIYGLEYKNYFLFVGAIEPKKNVSRLVDAYAASGTVRPLILAGGLGWQYESDVQRMNDERFKRFRLEDKLIRQDRIVRHLSYVPRSNLLKLIRGARALIFPSLYEGFGLPVLEAMMLRTAVITSNTSSLPEVAGDAAMMVDPTDVSTISRAIYEIDQDDDLCAALAAKGPAQADKFSPAAYRERLSSLYRSLT